MRSVCLMPHFLLQPSRGYAERQKIMAVLVEGQFMEVFLTPQNLGGGMFYQSVVGTNRHTAVHERPIMKT